MIHKQRNTQSQVQKPQQQDFYIAVDLAIYKNEHTPLVTTLFMLLNVFKQTFYNYKPNPSVIEYLSIALYECSVPYFYIKTHTDNKEVYMPVLNDYINHIVSTLQNSVDITVNYTSVLQSTPYIDIFKERLSPYTIPLFAHNYDIPYKETSMTRNHECNFSFNIAKHSNILTETEELRNNITQFNSAKSHFSFPYIKSIFLIVKGGIAISSAEILPNTMRRYDIQRILTHILNTLPASKKYNYSFIPK